MREAPTPERVVVVTSFSWPKPGGLERVIELELRELARRGIDVHLVCSRSDEEPAALLGATKVTVHRAPYRYHSFLPGFLPALFFAFWMAPTVRRLTRGGAPVHAHNTWAALCAILAGARKRTVLHLHSTSSKDSLIMESRGLPLAARALHAIDRWANRILEMVTYNVIPALAPVSEAEGNDTLELTRHPSRVHIVRNAVDTETFKPNAEARHAFRAKLGVPDDRIVILFVGRFVPKNGTLVLARAVPLLNRDHEKNVVWVFAGRGSEEAEMRAIVAAQPNVVFLPAQESVGLYPGADIFASHVSTDAFGHGLTILEAMSCGVPTLTGADAIKESLFAQGEDLLLVPKDDPAAVARGLARLVDDAPLRAKLAERGRATVMARFSVRAQVDAVLGLITRR